MAVNKTADDSKGKQNTQPAGKAKIYVKNQYRDEVVGFNGSGAPLGKRDDLIILAELALTVNPSLKEFFEELPSLEEIQAEKTRLFLEKTK
jgi:hypothetical protein